MNKTIKECTLIEQLILKNLLEKLSREESARLAAHTKECPDCRRLQLHLSTLHKSLNITETDRPAPRPEIQMALQQRVKDLKSLKNKSRYSIREFLANILQRPIPLYQAAIIILLTVCVTVFALNNMVKNSVESSKSINEYYSKDYIYEQYINYYPDRSTLPQKVGINAAEDTSFNSILFSAL